MRTTYSCFFYANVEGEWLQNPYKDCWGSLYDSLAYWLKRPTLVNVASGLEIYIDDFDYPDTRQYQGLLTETINQITPCQIVSVSEITGKEANYIKFKCLETYQQSLVLLNFIRNLWYEPVPGYTKKFFEALEAADHEDQLSRLLWANKEACPIKLIYSPGHCAVHKKASLKIRKVSELKEWTAAESTFLTGIYSI